MAGPFTYVAYNFGLVAPGATPSVFLHGFSPDNVNLFDLHATSGDASPTIVHPSISWNIVTEGEHVDGTLFYTFDVTNKTWVSSGSNLAAEAIVSIDALSMALPS